jgi:hypothetical protein
MYLVCQINEYINMILLILGVFSKKLILWIVVYMLAKLRKESVGLLGNKQEKCA